MTSETRALLEEIGTMVSDVQHLTSEDGTVSAQATTGVLMEHFDRLMGVLRKEDRGWSPLFNGNQNERQFGLTLQDLKDWDSKIVESSGGAAWIKRGFSLRNTNVWKDGIRYSGLPGGTQGARNIEKIVGTDQNQTHFFGKEARSQRERRLYTSGIAFWIGNDATKQLEAIPLWQITNELTHPDAIGEVWAYLREWTRFDLETGKSRQMKMWFFTDRHAYKRVLNIKSPGTNELIPVSQREVIFDQHANRPGGLVYGFPDALAAYIWNAIARDAYMDGTAVTDGLARIIMKATSKTKQGAQNAAMAYASADVAGSAAVLGGATDLAPLATAGKGYDFESLRPLVAVLAAGLDVSTTSLLADAGGEGSYASAVTLDRPTRLAMEDRREEHVELDKRVLKWMGVDFAEKHKDATVKFVPFDAGEEAYRILQGFHLTYANNGYTVQEMRDFTDAILGLPRGKVPEGDERPFGDLAKNAASAGGTALPQTASPNQGKSNGTGGQSGGSASNDLRSDSAGK